MERAYALPAPAKLNLFLHVLGRHADGYHELQSALVLIELADWIDIERRADRTLRREGDLVGAAEGDLALRAARLLQLRTGTAQGANIRVTKRIPAGAGLGGGSSDAATTLIALNRIWNTGLDRRQLAELALELGADVPFFVHGTNAFAEGRGERLSPLVLEPFHYALIWPQVAVSTQEIFQDAGLTRNTKATRMADFSAAIAKVLPNDAWVADTAADSLAADAFGVDAERVTGSQADAGSPAPALFGTNDLEPVARRRVPEIDRVSRHLEQFGAARMTGSGSAVFALVRSAESARAAVSGLPSGWTGWSTRGLREHPLRAW